MTFRADLHCHSTASDGTYTPQDLIQYAKQKGLQGLAITDHDTMAAWNNLTVDPDLKLISGIEVSTDFHGASIHVLGYAMQRSHAALLQLCERQKKYREERNQGIIHLLEKQQVVLSEAERKELIGSGSIGRPHFAKILLARGLVSTIQQAFDQYLGEGKPCYYAVPRISTEEAIKSIHAANGYCVLAHPHLIKPKSIVKGLLKLPFDGLECYYGRFPLHLEQRWLDMANSRGLLVTGGSDFHGSVKPTIDLGSSWVDESRFTPLWERERCNNH